MTDKYVVVGTNDCKWCDKALGLLRDRGEAFVYYDTTIFRDIAALLRGFNLTTVPQVWLVNEAGPYHIGGYEDLSTHMHNKEAEENV